jgi:hypothetical protein
MNLRTLVASAFLLAVPAVASAQPSYYAQPANPGYYAQPTGLPGGFHDRRNRLTVGIGLGFGGMKSEGGPINCTSCDYNPITVGVTGHIGYMMNERLGLLLELQANGQTVEDNIAETVTLVQGAAMFAAQYWVTPQLWIKGGIGAAHLQYTYDDWAGTGEEPVDDGMAVLGAVGYELLSARHYSLDLQGRLFVGSYEGIDDQISSGTISLGLNWF